MGCDLTAIEAASVILAFIAIGLSIKGTRWAWPPYFLLERVHGWLFVEFDLFASAAMQLISWLPRSGAGSPGARKVSEFRAG